ncbi:ABC-type transport auxiliary lipoprotein family protein, partial [Erythrobacter sp. HI0028]
MIRLLSKNLPIIVVLVGLTGCGGGVLGIGDETSLYRVGNNADTAPAVAQGRIPLYIARPQMPSGADADRIPTVEMQEITYLAEARWASPAPEMISDLLKESIERNVNQAYV